MDFFGRFIWIQGILILLRLQVGVSLEQNSKQKSDDEFLTLYREFMMTEALPEDPLPSLHHAAVIGNVSAIPYHLDQINSFDQEKYNPMARAIQFLQADFVRSLCHERAFLDTAENSTLLLALSLANDDFASMCASQLKKVIDIILRDCQGSVLLTVTDEFQNTALHTMANLGQLENIKYLLEEVGLELDARNDDDQTPLMIAVKSDNTEVARYLIEKGADTSLVDNSSNTLLHYGGESNALVNLTSLMDIIDINSQNEFGETPLHRCAYWCHQESCGLLLKRQANPTLKDIDNKTCLDYAIEGKCLNTYFYIKNYGNESSYITEDQEFQFLARSLRTSTSNIQDYADFILSQRNFSSNAGPILNDLKALNVGKRMLITYEKLDEHFHTSQETARQWSDIKLIQEKSITDIADFGKSFLESYKTLDKNSPGVLSILTEEKKNAIVRSFMRSKQRQVRNKNLLKELAKDYLRDLDTRSREIFLGHVKDLVDYVNLHAENHENQANKTLMRMQDFVHDLQRDFRTFSNDRKDLMNLTVATKDDMNKTMKELSQYSGLSDEAKQAIDNLGEKIDSIYSSTRKALIANIAITSFSATVSGTSMGIDVAKYFNKRKLRTSMEKLNEVSNRRGIIQDLDDYFRRKGPNPEAELDRTKAMDNLEVKKGKYAKKVKKGMKFKKIFKRAGMALQAIGLVADFASVGFQIYNMIEMDKQQKELQNYLDNIQNYTKVYLDSVHKLSEAQLRLNGIAMTDVQRTLALNFIIECMAKLEVAIEEANFLKDMWSNIVKYFMKMKEDAIIASQLQSGKEKTEKIDYIIQQLIKLRESWEKVSWSAMEVAGIIDWKKNNVTTTTTTPVEVP